MPPIRYQPNRLIATANRGGSAGLSILRMQNLFIRGEGEHTYAEVNAGYLDLDEDLPAEALTGTISMTEGNFTITGTGTAFLSEISIGQRLLADNNKIIVVREIFSDTSFDATERMTSDGTENGLTVYQLRILFSLGVNRGSLLTGNALEYDLGTLLAVGKGALYKNGSLLPGDSLVASKRAQIALKQSNGDYIVQTLGFTEPVGITAAPSATPAASSFTDAEINTATDTINDVGHGFSTGQQVAYTTGGTFFSIDGTPITATDSFYIIRVDADNYQLASSLANAVGGTELDITNAGSGTFTATPISKVMPAGVRSLRVSKASTKLGTPSFGNPGTKIPVAALTAGQAIAITFPAMDSDSDPNDPHDAWRIEGTEHGGTTGTTDVANAANGPWFWVRTVDSTEVDSSGGTYILEYLDAEINASPRLTTFDNDPPPDAEFVASASGYPVLVSCSGPPTTDEPNGTSPGPTIVPFKPHNIAAAPLILDNGGRNEVPTSPPEPIIGFYLAAGRIYLMTPNTLQIAVFVADPDFPVQIRPFWKSGFSNPYALCFVNSILYGFTSAGAIRSATEGEPGSEEHRFAADVEELMYSWYPWNVFVVDDQQNECVCYINSGFGLNEDGFFESEILCFMLRSQTWSYHLVTSTTEDRIISGAASVNGHLEFLAGGRLAGAVYGVRTFRFDTPNPAVPEEVPWKIGFQFTDAGGEQKPKKVKFPLVRGKLTSATFGLHGVEVDEDVDMDVFEAGTAGSKTGSIDLDDTTNVTWYPQVDVAVGELLSFAPQLQGTWAGEGVKDQIHEIVLDVIQQGSRR